MFFQACRNLEFSPLIVLGIMVKLLSVLLNADVNWLPGTASPYGYSRQLVH